MSKTFSIASTRDPRTLLARARRAADGNNAELRGDESSGTFSGNGFEGAYRMDGKVVTVTVTRKPLLAPWPLVESGLKRLLA